MARWALVKKLARRTMSLASDLPLAAILEIAQVGA
jgi:hypothetical protein